MSSFSACKYQVPASTKYQLCGASAHDGGRNAGRAVAVLCSHLTPCNQLPGNSARPVSAVGAAAPNLGDVALIPANVSCIEHAPKSAQPTLACVFSRPAARMMQDKLVTPRHATCTHGTGEARYFVVASAKHIPVGRLAAQLTASYAC